MQPIYEYLKPSIPTDHCKQVRAVDLVKERVSAGFDPANVLDLGCGTGGTIDFFKRVTPSAKWVGVDIEESPRSLTAHQDRR